MNDIIERYQSGEGIKCTTKHSEDSHEHVEIFGSGTAKTGHHSKIYEKTRRNVVIWQVVFMCLGYVVG